MSSRYETPEKFPGLYNKAKTFWAPKKEPIDPSIIEAVKSSSFSQTSKSIFNSSSQNNPK
jgi:hypothetical protein